MCKLKELNACKRQEEEKKELELYRREGNYIYFGEYPQTIKADNVTVGHVADSDGYYMGSDGERYAKLKGAPFDGNSKFSNGQKVKKGKKYYFKVEPIKWRILNDGSGKLFILSEKILENHIFDASSNNYAKSDIRKWLNGDFYNKAFNALQKELIQTTNVDNSVSSTGCRSNSYACENTNDKVFLPSAEEVTTSSYGFNSDYIENDTARKKQPSDYCAAKGIYMGSNGNGWWWLRSLNYSLDIYARDVDYEGCVYIIGCIVINTDFGAAPALVMRLS